MKHHTLTVFALTLFIGACTTVPTLVQPAHVYMPENVCKLRGCIETANVSAQLRNLGELVYFYTPDIGSPCWADQLTLFVASFHGEVPQADLEHLECHWNLSGVIPPAAPRDNVYTA